MAKNQEERRLLKDFNGRSNNGGRAMEEEDDGPRGFSQTPKGSELDARVLGESTWMFLCQD